MMNMLGLRGSASKSKPPDSSPSSSAPVAASSSSPQPVSGFGKAVRLVACDERGRFRMEPEAVAALQLVKGPVGVVSVCGRARTGKSYILNQLLGRSSGFQVASTHRPCTKGLWMWSSPIKRTMLDGTDYNLLLLDTEGIDAYDQTGTYSIQIFSLAVLLSSMFIYNQMGGIDEAALDRLSLVSEMTKHIRVRSTGGSSSASELGQFSPIFVWLLRDFYLELAEENRKITPRDYLELALRPLEGKAKDLSSKNEIRESIRALFPDRECFALVRPLNDEIELQHLDQMPSNRLRKEFRAGLDLLVKFVFERTRPKQVGGTVMTGPVLVGVLQSFLDAINNGAVPTIASSWQSVEEAECRRAYESASDVYVSSFDRNHLPEEGALRDAHEVALRKCVDAYKASAVGTGLARANFEKLLHDFCKKTFEEYRRNAFLNAEKECSNAVEMMEKKIRTACIVPGAKATSVLEMLEGFLLDYEATCHGPGKWKILASFLRQCFEGPLLDLYMKQVNQAESEKTALALRVRSSEDKLEILKKQLEANERHKSEYMKRYQDAISDKQNVSDGLGARLENFRAKCSTLEERCVSISRELDLVRRESSDWKTKYENTLSEQKAEQARFMAQKSALESNYNIADGKLTAAREQMASAQDEALEWRRKYEGAALQAKSALERLSIVQERINTLAQERADAIRGEFSAQLEEKEEEIKTLKLKFVKADSEAGILLERLQELESKAQGHNMETTALKDDIKDLISKLEYVREQAAIFENESKILEKEKNHLQENFVSECKKVNAAEERLKAAEREVKRANESANAAQKDLIVAQKDKSEAQQLSMERLSVVERTQRKLDKLQQEKEALSKEVHRLRQSEAEALEKVSSLEKRVDQREREIEDLLNRNNEQRSNTVHVLESLLATEREARSEANKRSEALSLQLQSTQGKLDALHQELTSVRLVETALDNKLRAAAPHSKRLRVDNEESFQDMDFDDQTKRRKKSKHAQMEGGGSVQTGDDNTTQTRSMEVQDPDSGDYMKFTMNKLKQELTRLGFSAQLLALKNPNKKDIVALYEKHVLGR